MSPDVPVPGYGIVLDKNSIVVARDGTELACDVYRPDGPGPFPAILTMLPYRKNDVAYGACHEDYFVPRGHAVVSLDMRGTGGSGGVTESGAFCGPIDQLDGYDAVEWTARQPWCDGNVGMTGVSFGWFTSLMTATRRPPHLKAIAPIYGGVDFYDDWNEGGSMLGHLFTGRYSAQMLAYNAAPPSYRDPSGRWRRVWERHLDGNGPWLFSWLENQTETGFWRDCSVKYHYDEIDVPVFAIGGWNDFNPTGPLRLFEGIKTPVKLLLGPWTHMEPADAIPGPRIDHLHELLRWWDYWFKGVDNGLMDEPPITLFVQQGARDPARPDRQGYWRFESGWPPAGAGTRRLYLAPGGRLSSRVPKSAALSDSFEYRPTVGVSAGLVGGVASGVGHPEDQWADAAYSLVYTAPPARTDTELTWRSDRPPVRLVDRTRGGVRCKAVRRCPGRPVHADYAWIEERHSSQVASWTRGTDSRPGLRAGNRAEGHLVRAAEGSQVPAAGLLRRLPVALADP